MIIVRFVGRPKNELMKTTIFVVSQSNLVDFSEKKKRKYETDNIAICGTTLMDKKMRVFKYQSATKMPRNIGKNRKLSVVPP